MRSSETGSLMVRDPKQQFLKQQFLGALKLTAIVLAVGLVVSANAARAGDDEEDDRSFEEKIIDNVMSGLGAKSMSKPGIDYRERSPLVVPPKLDLPPPVSSAAEEKAAPANWPKDPDEKRRKEALAARKKATNKPKEAWEAGRPLTPSELNSVKTATPAREGNDPIQPGAATNPTLSPSQLGFSGGLLGMFKGSKSSESTSFTAEPPRESLVEPPPGYQTPSPNFAYGTGPDNSKRTYFDVMSGKDKVQ